MEMQDSQSEGHYWNIRRHRRGPRSNRIQKSQASALPLWHLAYLLYQYIKTRKVFHMVIQVDHMGMME